MRVLKALLTGLSIILMLSAGLVASDPPAAAPEAARKQVVKKKAPAKKEFSAQERKREPLAQGSNDTKTEAQDAKRPAKREPFTAAELALAAIPSIPKARFWADSEQEFLAALPTNAGPWLLLSGGGADGAFGAGLLNGWTQSGQRPQFAVVTGVSTGGLLATFAFLGSKYDDQLREQYTKVTAADVFEIGSTGESLFDTWPLKKLIEKQVTPELLAAVAEAHAGGRRLFVVTTNLDAERPVVWNMGAIAEQGGDAALKLFRDVLLASASLPGLFPPVVIETRGQGRTLPELHAEGGLGGPFFVAPRALLSASKSALLPATEFYIVLNSKLAPDFYMTERNTATVLARSIAAALKTVMRHEAHHIYAVAQREGIGFHVAYVEGGFAKQARGPFDSEYMNALFERAMEMGRDGTAFRTAPPGS